MLFNIMSIDLKSDENWVNETLYIGSAEALTYMLQQWSKSGINVEFGTISDGDGVIYCEESDSYWFMGGNPYAYVVSRDSVGRFLDMLV